MKAARPRVACFTPLRPDPSGVSDYSEELLPHLGEHWDLDLFVSGYTPAADHVDPGRVVDVARSDPLPLLPSYDAVLYHLGNSPSHIYAYDTFLRHPGLVVLHDPALPHLLIEKTVRVGRRDLFFRELRAQHGAEAVEAARRHFYRVSPAFWDHDPLRFPCNRPVIEQAHAILVHSRFAAEALRAEARAPVVELAHHVYQPPELASLPRGVAARPPGSPFTLVTAGFLTPAKQIETVLRALSALRRHVRFRYRLVGRVTEGYRLRRAVAQLGLRKEVVFTGPVSKAGLYRELCAADVCVNLRHPTCGETSGMVLRALACGRPVVVSDAGWFAELPDACVRRIPAGDDAAPALAATLRALAEQPLERARLEAGARRHADAHTPASRARGYHDFVTRFGRSADPGRRLAVSAADEARAAGIDADALGLEGIARGLVGGRG